MSHPSDQGTRSPDPPPVLVHRTDRSHWNWLLLIPIVIPLIIPIYNRETPRLFGFPFIFWFQMVMPLLAAAITAVVFLATRRRRRT